MLLITFFFSHYMFWTLFSSLQLSSIFSLQAFEPPLDMSLDVDHSHQEGMPDNDYDLCERSRCSIRTTSISGNVCKCDEASCGERENAESVSSKWMSNNEV